MGFFDFFKKKQEYIHNSSAAITRRNPNEIEYYEMTPSKASCLGITSTPIPSKTHEVSKPKNFRITNLTMNFFRRNV